VTGVVLGSGSSDVSARQGKREKREEEGREESQLELDEKEIATTNEVEAKKRQ